MCVGVNVGHEGPTPEDVAAAAARPVTVSTVSDGWCTAFPEDHDVDALGPVLHEALSCPVVMFLCSDSDLAYGTLLADGAEESIVVCSPTGEAADTGIVPEGDPFFAGTYMSAWGDVRRWVDLLGVGEAAAIERAIAADADTPFAEGPFQALFDALGLSHWAWTPIGLKFADPSELPSDFDRWVVVD